MTAGNETTGKTRKAGAVAERTKRLVGLGGATTNDLYRTIAAEGDSSAHRALARHIARHHRHRLHGTLFLVLGALNLWNALRHLRSWQRLGALGITALSFAAVTTFRAGCRRDRQGYTPLLDRLDAARGAAHSAAADRAASTKSANGDPSS